MNQTTPAREKQARKAQARATDRAESNPAEQAQAPDAVDSRTGQQGLEAVNEDPTMDEDEHEAHRTPTPTAPLGH
jgi:hypothetical protein